MLTILELIFTLPSLAAGLLYLAILATGYNRD